MLDIRLIRERPDFVKAELAKTGVDPAEIDRVIAVDADRRRLQHELDEMRARRTRESRELGKAGPEERESKRAEMRELGDRIAAGEHELTEIEQRFNDLMLGLRNIPRPYVPVGRSEADNKVARSEGEPAKFDFKPLPHWELGERLGIIDFERGVKLSGTRFYVLVGAGARLERALITWMLDLKTREQGYLEIAPPLMVSTATATSTGHLPKNADTMYRDIEEDYWFIPTAEVPLTSLYRDEILDADRLPIYVVQLCTGDLSFSSAATYDIELWAPGLNEWLEVSSCSNCTDFQMRRANIRYRPQKNGRPDFLHALNGSGLGLPRTLIAVLENYQQADGSVIVPEVLRPYMGGLDVIKSA
jgi:seryl-tRNA synthetase